MKYVKYLQTGIITTAALLFAIPASAAVMEEAHSRTELNLPPAVAEAIRETGGAVGDHVAADTDRPIEAATRRLQAQEAPATVGPSTTAPAPLGASVSVGEGTLVDSPSNTAGRTEVNTAGRTEVAKPAEAAAPLAEESAADDYAMTELLAVLDGEDTESSATKSGGTGGIQAAGPNPMGRAVPVTAFAFLCLMGMLAHPRTRKFAFGRLVGTSGLGGLGGRLDEISMHSSRDLGPGQKVVALDIDGHRVLVGVSAGRMDLLHTWEDIDGLIEDPDLLTQTMFDPGMILSEARRPASPTSSQAPAPVEDIESLRKRVAQATPSPQELLAAFGNGASQRKTNHSTKLRVAPTPALTATKTEETPWWMEGATGDERERILGTGSATESVLEKMRAAKERGVTTVSSRPAAVARRATSSQPPRPTAKRRGPPRFVLGLLGGLIASAFMMVPELALAADGAMQINVGGDTLNEGADAMGASTPIKLLITMTLLAIAPAIILSMTSFTRLIIIFSLMRQAVGVQQAPPNQILIGLALFLTWFIMGPTFTQVNDHAVQPYFDGELTEGEALEAGMVPMRKFMMKNTRKKDLALFLRLSASPRPQSRADVPTRALVPAFIISELKTAFQIGFLIYIPFLIIDLVVATVLLAMGMMVLPPVVISLPFKLLLFVFIDGWNLLVGSVVRSFA